MSGFSEKDWLDDFARRVKGLMCEIVAESGQSVDWEMLPITANNRHPQIVISVGEQKFQFQIDQEEQALGTSDEQIKETLRGYVRLAHEG